MDNLSQVVESIERLYNSRDPNEINLLQQQLQRYQKADNGQLAKALMEMDSVNCKFFGALTYTVVITSRGTFNDGNDDPDAPNDTVLYELIGQILSYINQPQLPPMILKKLLSNLALIFLYNYTAFPDPVGALLKQLTSGHSTLNGLPIDITTLDEPSFIILLNFCAILVEDMVKREKITGIHQVVYDNIFPIVTRIFQYLNSVNTIPYSIHIEALNCLNSWIIYTSMAETQSKVRYPRPDALMAFLFKTFSLTRQGLEDETMELVNKSISTLTETLETNPQMIHPYKPELESLLFGETNFGTFFVENIIFNFDIHEQYEDESANFINLLVTFVLNDLLRVSKNLLQPNISHILNTFLKLSNYPGIPVINEKISEQLLNFWDEFFNTFIDDEDTFINLLKDSPDEALFYQVRNNICNSVCEIYLHKIKFSIDHNSLSVDFFKFRSDVGDLFSALYSLLKLPFYDDLTKQANNHIKGFIDGDINLLFSLEATVFVLYKINDDSTFYQSQSDLLLSYVDQILDGGVLRSFSSIDQSFPHYSFVISSFIRYISSIEFYFKSTNGPKYLGDIFDILFSIILKNDSKLSLIASKTILNICQECRSNLVGFLPNLKILLLEMLQNIGFDDVIRQRMANSYTSIAQTEISHNPDRFGNTLIEVLQIIDSKSSEIMQSVQSPDETTEDYLVSLLSCVNEIGKGCVIPEEVEDIYDETQTRIIDQYWQEDHLGIKSILLSIVEKFSISYQPLINKSTVTELCCQILKSGLNEPINSPFKFDLNIIFNYLTLKINNCDANSVYHIFKLFETVVITNYVLLDQSTIEEVINKLFLNNLNSLITDPDMIQSCIDAFTSILDKRPSLLINLNNFNSILSFMIDNLLAKESIIIRSVLKFWISLISLKKGNASDHETIKNLLTNEDLGSILTSKLLESFLNSSRSLLDNYFPIFRNLISKFQIFFKNWLVGSLLTMPSSFKLNDEDKKLFVNQLMITRGQRVANDILKNFWLKANGLIEFNTQSF